MKAFLMKIPEILQGISKNLDVQAILCGRAWVIFNDENKKIVFIFEKDGTLIISRNGNASKGFWNYISANSTILIEESHRAFLLHPSFLDEVIFALRQDGTEHYVFMIDEKCQNMFDTLCLNSLHQYFSNKAQKAIESQEQLKKQTIEEELIKERRRQEDEKLRSDRMKIMLLRKRLQKETIIYTVIAMLIVTIVGGAFLCGFGYLWILGVSLIDHWIVSIIGLLGVLGMEWIGMHIVGKAIARKILIKKVNAISERLLFESGLERETINKYGGLYDQFWDYIAAKGFRF